MSAHHGCSIRTWSSATCRTDEGCGVPKWWQRTRRVESLRSRGIGLRTSLESARDTYAAERRFDYASIRVNGVGDPLVFDECTFREAVITGNLSNVVFRGCSLDDTDFDTTGANGCDPRGSRLNNARGLSRPRGARITLDQAASAAVTLAAEAGLTIED